MLQAFDPADPLSAKAVEKLQAFQAQVPPVAYTTAQMRESAKKGILDAMIMEYQAYSTEPTLSDYVFTPFGVRHDSPVYALGGITEDQKAVLKMFTAFCLEAQAQRDAARYGFQRAGRLRGPAAEPFGRAVVRGAEGLEGEQGRRAAGDWRSSSPTFRAAWTERPSWSSRTHC